MVSVIIPLYNAGATVIDALESVRNQEGYSDFEIFVVNDGSTDDGPEKVREYIALHPELDIKLISQKNKGVSCARNVGLRIATGEFIALLDADDIWLPQKTVRQLDYLQNPDLQIDMLGCGRNGKKIRWPYNMIGSNPITEVTFGKLLIRNEMAVPTIVFKRKILENTGFFDEKFRYAEDFNFLLRVSKNNKIGALHEDLVIAGGRKKSFGVSGLSSNLKEMHKGFNKNLKEMRDAGRISKIDFVFYRIFYKFKYLLLIFRTTTGW